MIAIVAGASITKTDIDKFVSTLSDTVSGTTVSLSELADVMYEVAYSIEEIGQLLTELRDWDAIKADHLEYIGSILPQGVVPASRCVCLAPYLLKPRQKPSTYG